VNHKEIFSLKFNTVDVSSGRFRARVGFNGVSVLFGDSLLLLGNRFSIKIRTPPTVLTQTPAEALRAGTLEGVLVGYEAAQAAVLTRVHLTRVQKTSPRRVEHHFTKKTTTTDAQRC
jgi:hypothetical protein